MNKDLLGINAGKTLCNVLPCLVFFSPDILAVVFSPLKCLQALQSPRLQVYIAR